MSTIRDIFCRICKLGPADGVSVYRLNPKGEKGIWGCKEHSNPDPITAEMVETLEAARDMGIGPRDAGEILGAKVVE